MVSLHRIQAPRPFLLLALVAALMFLAAAARQSSPTASAAGTDTDGDGASDIGEELTGSDPNDPDSFPESTGAQIVSGFLGMQLALCSDGVDNDLDGLTDLDDPGCTDSDNDIVSDPAEERLGSDPNDATSFPEDARVDAVLADAGIPISFCGDFVDNDGDGLTDGSDPGCSPVDSDDDGFQDAVEKRFGSDPNDAGSTPEHEIAAPGSCSDGIDNDGNGLADSVDPGCGSPPNDDRANATDIDALPYSDGPLSFKNATIEPREPSPNCGFATSTVWYRYDAPRDHTLIAAAAGDQLYPMIAAYHETASGIDLLTCSQDYGYEGARSVVNVESGESYLFQVGAYIYGGAEPFPAVTFSVVEGTPPQHDGFLDATPVEALPFADSVDTSAATTQIGEPTCRYDNQSSVWYTFSPTSSTLVVADTRGSDYGALIGAFTQTKFGLIPEHCGDPAGALAFDAQAGTTYYIQVSRVPGYILPPAPLGGIALPPGFEPPGFSLQFNLAIGVPPANDDFANAVEIGALPTSTTGNNLTATNEDGEPAPSCIEPYSAESTIWYRYTTTTDAILVADTGGSGSFDLALGVYTGDSIVNLNEVACAVSYYPGRLGFKAAAGETYYIQIGTLTYDNVVFVAGEPDSEEAAGVSLGVDPHDVVLNLQAIDDPACPAPTLRVEDPPDDATGFFFGPPPGDLYRPDITSVTGSFTNEDFCLAIEFDEEIPEPEESASGIYAEITFDADNDRTTGIPSFGRCGSEFSLGIDTIAYVQPGNLLAQISVYNFPVIVSVPVAGFSPTPQPFALVIEDERTLTLVIPRSAIGLDESFNFTVGVNANGFEDCVPDGGFITSPVPAAMGDVDCDGAITSIDSALIQQLWADLSQSLPCQHLADVNGTEVIGPIDALLILQYVAGLLDELSPP